jgi:hypothetical protein
MNWCDVENYLIVALVHVVHAEINLNDNFPNKKLFNRDCKIFLAFRSIKNKLSTAKITNKLF